MFDAILVFAFALDSVLPLVRFAPRLTLGDGVLLFVWLGVGYAFIRSAHSLLGELLRSKLPERLSSWASTVVSTFVVAAVAAQGVWGGPPHWAVLPTGVIAIIIPPAIRTIAGPPGSSGVRMKAALVMCGVGYVVITAVVTMNMLYLFPRYASPVGANMAAAWFFALLAIASPWSLRTSTRVGSVAVVLGGALFLLSPQGAARSAGYARRQTELGAALHPMVWGRGMTPPAYIAANVRAPRSGVEYAVELEGTPRPRPVLLITIDTLRADLYLENQGDLEHEYPNLAALVKDGCRYTDARTVSAYTHVSMPALYNGTLAFDAVKVPLTKRLADAANLVPRAFGRLWMMDAYTGFPHDLGGETDATMIERLLVALRRDVQVGRPTFYAVHFLDVHLPKKAEVPLSDWSSVRAIYAARLREVDAHIGRILRIMKDAGWYDDALVIVTADHGEELGERGYTEHAFHLYDTVMKVPYIVKDDRGECGTPDAPVSVLDTPARLAQGLGLRFRAPELEGMWPPSNARVRFAVSTMHGPYAAWVRGTEKVIVDLRYGDIERYDLKLDPTERVDLGAALDDDVAAVLRGQRMPWNPHVPPPLRMVTVSSMDN